MRRPWIFYTRLPRPGTESGGAVNTYVAAAALFGKVDSGAIVRVAREMNIG